MSLVRNVCLIPRRSLWYSNNIISPDVFKEDTLARKQRSALGDTIPVNLFDLDAGIKTLSE